MGTDATESILTVPNLSQNEMRYLRKVTRGPNMLDFLRKEMQRVRAEGNRYFQKGDFSEAIDNYTRCIQIGRGFQLSGSKRCRAFGDDIMTVAASNRAQAYLELRMWEKALSSADDALYLDPHHVKSLFRKGKALQGLQEYEKARAVFESVLELRPQNDSCKQALKEVTIAYHQSVTGEYDLRDYFVHGGDPPLCSDFVGPVEIRRTLDRGRGLFLTQGVQAGELLLVSNALGLGGSESLLDSPDCWVVNLACDFLQLFDSSQRYAYQLHYLRGTEETDDEKEVPPLKLYIPGSDWAPDPDRRLKPPSFNVAYTKARLNSFDASRIGDPNSSRLGTNLKRMIEEHEASTFQICAVWALPSLINHSCVPNCSTNTVGKAMFVRAGQSMPAGTQISIPYVVSECMDRSNSMKIWDFECSCEKCVLDKRVEPLVAELYERYKVQMNEFYGMDGYKIGKEPNLQVYKIASEQVDLVEDAIAKLPFELNDTERNWIRFAFQRAYILQLVQCPHDVTRLERIDLVRRVLAIYSAINVGTFGLNMYLSVELLRGIEQEYGEGSKEYRSARRVVRHNLTRVLGPVDDDFLQDLLAVNFKKDEYSPFYRT
ncbi:protein MpATXR3 [Marchantia polymorpha subsp. ruderalis]